MKLISRLAGVLGFAGLLWLVLGSHPGDVWRQLQAAGAGLFLAAACHVFPMLASAGNWRPLLPVARPPSVAAMLRWVWIRESVNALLPVARIGGEVVVFRSMRRAGLPAAAIAGSLLVDTQLCIVSQLLYTLLGLGLLLGQVGPPSWRLVQQLLWGTLAVLPLIVGFGLLQHAGPFARVTRFLNRLTGGKLEGLVGHSEEIDRTIPLIWQRRRAVLAYLFFWQPLHGLGTSCELWLLLHFLGAGAHYATAMILDSLVQALASASFIVPGALGVQEGGFVLLGGMLGLEPATCLALAAGRRLRDLVVYLPGLLTSTFEPGARGETHPVPA